MTAPGSVLARSTGRRRWIAVAGGLATVAAVVATVVLVTATSAPPDSSASAASGSAAATVERRDLVATVDLAASAQSEAVVGGRVTVEMPDGSTVRGTITAISRVASSSTSSGSAGSGSGSGGSGASGGSGSGGAGSSSTVPVTIRLDTRVHGGGLDQASISVKFARARANDVLSVPITALVATAGGRYAIREAGTSYRLIPVTTGLFAGGYVQISGAGIHPGLRVTDTQG